MDTSENNFRPYISIREAGVIREIKNGIVKISGMGNCIYGQMLTFASGAKGMVMGFNAEESIGLVFDDEEKVSVDEKVFADNELISTFCGEEMIGRVVDCLGNPLDEKGSFKRIASYPVFRKAKGIMDRIPLDDPLLTGTKIVDLGIPVGKGQRELIIGDRQSGKSTIGLDAIISQKDRNVICIYCWIGGAEAVLKKHVSILNQNGAMEHTIVVCAPAHESAAKQYIIPFSAASIGEYFMERGKDVLIVFDDLTKHAWMYRQISLLMNRSPGREAYPGDVFYLHSQLLERACRLKPELGGGTMTFLPIVETLQGDISGYIQTNVISITDGQIVVNGSLFKEGFKPAVDLGLSVSRIGSKVQTAAIKSVSKGLRLEFAQYRQMLKLTKLKTKLSPEMEAKMRRWALMVKLLMQPANSPVSFEEQTLLFYLFNKGYLEIVEENILQEVIEKFYGYFQKKEPRMLNILKKDCELTQVVINSVEVVFKDFIREIKAKAMNNEKKVSFGMVKT